MKRAWPPMVLLLMGCSAGEPRGPNPPPPAAPPAVAAPAAGPDLGPVERALEAHDYAGAKAGAAAALAKAPNDPNANHYAGVADEGLGDKASAEKHYRAALAARPSLVEAATNLTLLLLDQNRAADALAALKPTLAALADDPVVQADLGAALAGSGDHAGAAAAYRRAMAKGAGPETRLAYAAELTAQNQKDAAVASLREGVAAAGNDRDQLAAYAVGLAKSGSLTDAISALDKALAIKASPDLLTRRGAFKRKLGDLAGARADMTSATTLDPAFAPGFVYLGELLEEMNKPADARQAYQTAIKLAGDRGPGKRAQERLAAMKK